MNLLPLFPALSPESRRFLDGLPGLIDKIFPLPKRFRLSLPKDVAELSRLLTSGRGDRRVSYLGQPKFLSAYLRYFLPWNLYRLCRLLPALPLSLNHGDALTDLGSGPLTFAAALWISRPELRNRSLEFRCVDQAGPALEAGKELFAALSGGSCLWKIKTVRAAIGAGPSYGRNPALYGPPARLVSAVNFFNELYEDIPHRDAAGLLRFADNHARFISSLCGTEGSLLIVEPGTPRSGEFIAALRAALLKRGRPSHAPCPHAGTCPCPGGRIAPGPATKPGGKGRWCHFAFDTADAAPVLRTLSAVAGIPKERAVVSFLYSGPALSAGDRAAAPVSAGPAPAMPVRIISDPFPVPPGGRGGENRGQAGGRADVFGRYGCCEKGLALIRGSRELTARYESGVLANFVLQGPEQRDPKSGALVLEAAEKK
ncbi:MAG: rRNA methyltransferase [Treponema sp.]|nr:rRNA methyltransferase [Treponema sp.]